MHELLKLYAQHAVAVWKDVQAVVLISMITSCICEPCTWNVLYVYNAVCCVELLLGTENDSRQARMSQNSLIYCYANE